MRVIASRKIDELGRLVLPQELRREYDITAGDALDVCIDNGGQIVLRKAESSCRICGATDDLIQVTSKSISICSLCQNEISQAK